MIFLLLSQLTSLRGRPPLFFPCDNNENGTEIYCTHRPLDNVPFFTSMNVTFLDLSHTKIREVGQHEFSGIPNLITLKMTGNCDPNSIGNINSFSCGVTIHKDAFRILHNLTYLYLARNSLTTLPWLPESIKVLDLESNCIFNISHPFGTPHLEQLFLTKNCYNENPCYQSFYIHEDVYNELSHLKDLTLGFNNMTSILLGKNGSGCWLDRRN